MEPRSHVTLRYLSPNRMSADSAHIDASLRSPLCPVPTYPCTRQIAILPHTVFMGKLTLRGCDKWDRVHTSHLKNSSVATGVALHPTLAITQYLHSAVQRLHQHLLRCPEHQHQTLLECTSCLPADALGSLFMSHMHAAHSCGSTGP